MAVKTADFVILPIIIYLLNITIGRVENKLFVKFFSEHGHNLAFPQTPDGTFLITTMHPQVGGKDGDPVPHIAFAHKTGHNVLNKKIWRGGMA
jgi:hypothetical protein